MSDLHKELQEQKELNINLQAEIRELHTQVRKWSTYCAYVAGSSIGIILFLQILSSEETNPECEVCAVCPEPVVCKEATKIIETSRPIIKEVPSAQKQIIKEPSKPIIQKEEPVNADAGYQFPFKYTIKSGDNFSILASRFYKRASLADWLAKQNNIDPSKLQIGQEITIPAPQ
jgi:hypothetical protein